MTWGRATSTKPVSRLRGMEDLSSQAWYDRRRVQDLVQALIGSRGYRLLETPILEPTELFLRKSGGQLASRLYSFIDSGSTPVSMRPEFTAPIMRHYLEHAAELDLPVRRQYAGPVFRYEDSDGTGGQFTQVGAELLGSDSVMADAELVVLAAGIPAQLGIGDFQVHLADMDLLDSVLETTGISERAKSLVIESVPKLRAGPSAIPEAMDRADRLRLISDGAETDELSRGIQGLNDDQAREVLQGMLQWSSNGRLGQRDPDQVVDRMLRKIKGGDTASSLQHALELAGRLACIRGEPVSALESARAVVQDAGASATALTRLEGFLELLQAAPDLAGRVVIDLGLLRGLAYYNGIVFEVKSSFREDSLGGGGRYDRLAGALGSPHPVPALGFAFNLESLIELVPDREDGAGSETEIPAVLVIAEGPGLEAELMNAAQRLRDSGEVVELDVSYLSLQDAIARAGRSGIKRVVSVNRNGAQTIHQVG